MAALMHRKSREAKPENRNRLAELAEAHRKIARIRAKKPNASSSENLCPVLRKEFCNAICSVEV
jgi:hypothetical protein